MRDTFETTEIGWVTIIVGWILTVLALVFVIIYIRSKFHEKLCLDDILLYLSFLLSLALMSVTTWAVVAEGQGQHQSAESRSQFELLAKSLLINEILWGIVNTFIRLGAIIFIRKVFLVPMIDKRTTAFNIITTMLLAASAMYAIAVLATSLAICQPISAGWDQTVRGRCGNEVVAYLCLEIIAAVLDLAIVIAPLPRIIRLKIAPRRKWLICVLFSLGFVVFIITGLRIAALNRVNSHDFSYDRGYIGLLSILGPLIAIICCCATSTVGHVFSRFRLWAKSRGFSPSNVVWSMISTRHSNRHSRWWSSTATRNNQETIVEREIPNFRPLASVSTSKSSEAKTADTTMPTLARSQSLPEVQYVPRSNSTVVRTDSQDLRRTDSRSASEILLLQLRKY